MTPERSTETGPRSAVRGAWQPQPGGTERNTHVRTWSRVLSGVPHHFTAILMPNGDRRYAVDRYNGYGDDGSEAGRTSGMRFGCAWSQRAWWVIKPGPAAYCAHPGCRQTLLSLPNYRGGYYCAVHVSAHPVYGPWPVFTHGPGPFEVVALPLSGDAAAWDDAWSFVEIYLCDGCAAYSSAELVKAVEGSEHCESCADELFTCGDCLRLCTDVYEVVSGEDYACQDCVYDLTQCTDCERYGSSHELTTLANGDCVCDARCLRRYEQCGGCGEWSRYGCDDCHYCDDCENYSEYECDCSNSSGLIHDYGYKPSAVFHGEGPVFLGLEVEIHAGYSIHESAQIAVRHLGDLGYLKEDCSVSGGFEIVTHPMSHAYALESFPFDMLDELRRNRCSAGDNGLHVHVSRKGFDSPAHVYRWLKLLHRNRDAVTCVARRDSDYWAPFRASDRVAAKDHAKGHRSADRYAAINVTNYATFEVRVFASTLDRTELMAALDLVAASVEYTRSLSVSAIARRDGWSWSAFSAWASQRPEYAALNTEMVDLCAS